MPNFIKALKAGLIGGAMLASAGAHAALVEYTSRAAFDAATELRSIEPNQAPPGGFYFLGGQDYNGLQYPGFAYFVDPAYEPALYEWGSGAVLLLDASESALSFAPVTAFAADFGSLPDGFAVTITIDGIATVIGTPQQRQLTFYGWTSSTPFSTVSFSTGAQYLILDNVTRGFALDQPPPHAEVPVPAPLPLIGLGLLGLAMGRRRLYKANHAS